LHTLLRQAVGAVGKWESCFWISTFPRPTVKELRFGFLFRQVGPSERWECGNLAGCARFPRDVGDAPGLGLVGRVFHGPSFPPLYGRAPG